MFVAPFRGAWIEIHIFIPPCQIDLVAPFRGAWIEIFWHMAKLAESESLPLGERGLK